MSGASQDGVLAWVHDMLVAPSLGAFAAIAADVPAHRDEQPAASLVLADPGHELRHLMFGADAGQERPPGPVFVDSLLGVAPQFSALHAPWCGEYRVADHALLFAADAGFRHLLMLPLRSGRQLIGVHCAASRGARPSLAELESRWLDHVAAAMSATLERLFDRARLLRAGMSDPLTGWNSLRYLQARLREELARCQRSGSSAAFLVVDVDRLHLVNECHGMPAGDLALREIGSRIESQVRASDAAAHLGSDEFAVLLPGASVPVAAALAERILAAVRSAPVELAPQVQQAMSVSIGIAAASVDAAEDRKAAADQLLAQAEEGLHRAKRRGGDCYEINFAAGTSAAERSARPRRR